MDHGFAIFVGCSKAQETYKTCNCVVNIVLDIELIKVLSSNEAKKVILHGNVIFFLLS